MGEHFPMSRPCPKIGGKQKKLTPEQEASARQFVHDRVAAMLSCQSIDEQEAEAHLRQAYSEERREFPRLRWFDSPAAFFPAHAEQILWNDEWESSWEASSLDTMDSLVHDLAESVWNSVFPRVRDETWDRPWKSMGTMTWRGVENSLEAKLGLDFAREEEILIHDGVRAYAQCAEFALLRFLHERWAENGAIHFARFNEMVSGYRLGDKEGWIIRKPLWLRVDAQGRLHSAEGSAVQYRDGWGCCAWHGVRVPARIIRHPEQITREDWLNERNLAIQRVIEERMPNFLDQVGGRCLETNAQGSLYTIDRGEEPAICYVHVHEPSAHRLSLLRVPPTIQSLDEAIAWVPRGLAEREYQPVRYAF